MKKIFLLLVALMSLFAATANAADVLTLKHHITQYNALQIEVEMTELTTYNVILEGNQLILTIDAPLIRGKKFNDNIVIKDFPLANRLVASSTTKKTKIRVPLNRPITESNYKVYTAKKSKIAKKLYDRIVLEISANKKPAPAPAAKPAAKPAVRPMGYAVPNVREELKDLNGPWYGENGQYAFSIDSSACTFTRNGKTSKITGVSLGFHGHDPATYHYIFKLNENGTSKTMKVCVDKTGATLFMSLGDDQILRYQNSKEVKYTESVGGVYLGMLRSQVESLYGAGDYVQSFPPTSHPIGKDLISNGYPFLAGATVKYIKDNWEIQYEGGRVYAITIFKGSNRRFDKSGLGYDSSIDEFARAYNLGKATSLGPVRMGNGENFFFYQNVKDSSGGKLCFARWDS